MLGYLVKRVTICMAKARRKGSTFLRSGGSGPEKAVMSKFQLAEIALRRPPTRGHAAVEHGVEVGQQLLGEAPLVEADGLAAGGLAAEVGGAGLERPQGVRKASRRLLGEQQAGGLLGPRRVRRIRNPRPATRKRDDRLGGAAAAEGDDGGAAGLGLDGDDAEVLFAGEEQGPAAAEVVADHRVG